jgi:hypothetical protein
VETGRVDGFIAAHSITTLFYLIQKDRSPAEARSAVTSLLQFIKIIPGDQNIIEQALNLDFRDFEDAVEMISAVQSKMDCLVPRKNKDYQPAMLPIMQPIEFLGTLYLIDISLESKLAKSTYSH